MIGILLFVGANKSGRQSMKDLWDRNGLRVEMCYVSISVLRFSSFCGAFVSMIKYLRGEKKNGQARSNTRHFPIICNEFP